MFYIKRIKELENIINAQDKKRLQNIYIVLKDEDIQTHQEYSICKRRYYQVFTCSGINQHDFRIAVCIKYKEYHLVFKNKYIVCGSKFKEDLYQYIIKQNHKDIIGE